MLLTWSLSRVPFSNKTGLPYVQRFGSNLAITLYLPFSFSSCSDSSLFESFFFAVCFCSESSCVANSFVDSATSFCWEVSTIFSASALSCSTVVSSLFISNSLLFASSTTVFSLLCTLSSAIFFFVVFFFHCYLPNYIFHFVLYIQFSQIPF